MNNKMTEEQFRARFSELPVLDALVAQCKQWVEFEEALFIVSSAADKLEATYNPNDPQLIACMCSLADDIGSFGFKLVKDAAPVIQSLDSPSVTLGTEVKSYTVIGFYGENDQIFSHHVYADSSRDAFCNVALEHTDAVLIAALDGHLREGQGIVFAGNNIVDSETFLIEPPHTNHGETIHD